MLQIIAFICAHPDKGLAGLRQFESLAIPILREHQGKLISASCNTLKKAHEPDEIHVIQFPSQQDFTDYKNDPRVTELAQLKSEMIKDMQLFITDTFHQYP